MTPSRMCPGLQIEEIGPVSVVTFTLSEILHVEVIESIGEEIASLVEDEGRRQLLFDLSEVRQLSSALIGKLLGVHKRLREVGGEMALCRLNPEVANTFELCQLPRLFHIYPTREAALNRLFPGTN